MRINPDGAPCAFGNPARRVSARRFQAPWGAGVFTEGHDTDPRDHGRPVVLVAAALGVTPEVFRDAFSPVHPAEPGSGGPTDAEARANKAALMSALGKFGVTDEKLNEVSNFYRYPPGSRDLRRHKAAVTNALV